MQNQQAAKLLHWHFKNPKMKAALLFCSLVFYSFILAAQEISPTAEFLVKRGYRFPEMGQQKNIPDSSRKWPDTLYYNTPYKPKLLGSPTIPFSFSRIERINGKYQLSPTISIGYGYTWFFGKFYLNENDKISVDPTFQFGIVGDVALQSDLSLNKLTGFFTGAFIGFANFSFFGGYDYITSSPLIGVGGRIDVYTFHQNSLKPIGRVREYRPHKKLAVPVLYE
jgi:hypothetical protein